MKFASKSQTKKASAQEAIRDLRKGRTSKGRNMTEMGGLRGVGEETGQNVKNSGN